MSSREGLTDSVGFTYDAWGWRSRKIRAGVTTYELRDDSGALLCEADSTGRVLRSYVRAEGRVLGALDSSGAYTAYVTDAAGSVRLGLDGQGAVRFQQEFLPYGEISHCEGMERPSLGFLGEQQDPETGYLYLRNRYYDPELARFLTPDPLRDSGAPAYGYTFGDPLAFRDASGLAAEPRDGADPYRISFELPLIEVFGRPVDRRIGLAALRLLRIVYGDRAGEEALRGYHWARFVLPRRARSIEHTIGNVLRRGAQELMRRVNCPVCPTLARAATLMAPITAQTIQRFMVAHEVVAGARSALAMSNARGLTPSERETIRLKAGGIILSETTLDMAYLLAMDSSPAASVGAALTAPLWVEMRGDVSDLTDAALTRVVPGYGDTSILDEIFGALPALGGEEL